jgi:hypothetical protein
MRLVALVGAGEEQHFGHRRPREGSRQSEPRERQRDLLRTSYAAPRAPERYATAATGLRMRIIIRKISFVRPILIAIAC